MEEFVIEEETKQEEAGADPGKAEDKAPGEIEALATEIGWRPDGELDAKAYILKSREIQDTMRTHIKSQKNQLAELGSSVEELKIHNERVFKAEVAKLKNELDTLKKEKREAIEEGDADRVDEIEGKMETVKEAMLEPKKPAKQQADAPVNEVLDKWLDKNAWYNSDAEMTAYADKISGQYPDAPLERVLKIVDQKVNELYPEKFAKAKTPAASPVEGATKRTATSKFTKADLTDGQRTSMNQFVKLGIMTEKQYLEDIAKTQGA